MPNPSAGADKSRRSVTTRRTVLLTGASGVVGRAVLDRLGEMDVICLVHRTPVTGARVSSVRGDVRQHRLGLSDAAYADLTGRIDAVIHCAAITEFNRTDGSLEDTNIEGTRHMVALAEDAGVPLYHVSTAFLHAKPQGERGKTATGYAASKRAGEDVVRAARTPHVILRPSVVIGDSQTGDVASFQGLYGVVGAIFKGVVPMIPFDPTWPIDFIPCDVVADAIVTVVERGITSGEFWLTSGEKALSLKDAVAEAVDLGAELGLGATMPKFVPPDLFDRLIAPVFLEALPARVRVTAIRLLEFFAAYLSMDSAMQSSLDELVELGVRPLPDQRESLRTSLQYWAEDAGLVASAEREVA
jgi:nucleoside-diphosphate-sugar epimerase